MEGLEDCSTSTTPAPRAVLVRNALRVTGMRELLQEVDVLDSDTALLLQGYRSTRD